MMLKIAILEDEIVYAYALKEMILSWAQGKAAPTVSIFSSVGVFFETMTSPEEYDLIFIDMTLDVDGILSARQLLKKGYKNTLIFIADKPDRAIEGYQVNAYRYYLKPLRPEDVKECLEYAWNKKATEFFLFSYRGISKRIPFDTIYFFESIGHYVHLHTHLGKTSVKCSLTWALDQCPSYFIRCHRSYVVNTHYILERTGNLLTLVNGMSVSLSPHYTKAIEQVFAATKKLHP